MAKIIRLSALAEGWQDLEDGSVDEPEAASPVGRMASMLDAMLSAGVGRQEALGRAVAWLKAFTAHAAGVSLLRELEHAPLAKAHPLEIVLAILERCPEMLPGVQRGAFIENAEVFASGAAGAREPVSLLVPRSMSLKWCVALDGARPGFAFFPSGQHGEYVLQVGSPGTWRFAVLATSAIELGAFRKETGAAVVEEFVFRVKDAATFLF